MIERMKRGDAVAREKLIAHNLRLCAHIARKYSIPGCEQDDLISIGTVGLIKGVGTYRPDSGTQLSTYCARCIENEILMCLRASQKRKNDISLQDPIGMDGEGNEIALIDVLGTDGGEVHDEVEKRSALLQYGCLSKVDGRDERRRSSRCAMVFLMEKSMHSRRLLINWE